MFLLARSLKQPGTTPLQRKLDAILSGLMQDNDVVGMAIGVVVDHDLVVASGYGVRQLGDEGPITDRSVVRWASVSKPFVATAIMQLVEEDQLALDDRLDAVLPYFRMADERYRQITIQQLLVHTSGKQGSAGTWVVAGVGCFRGKQRRQCTRWRIRTRCARGIVSRAGGC